MSRTDSPFLSRVGQPERSPLRWLGWIGATFVIWILGSLLVVGLLAILVDPDALSTMGKLEPLPETPGRLIDETAMMFLASISLAILAAAALWGAQIAFGRKAWTFVTPARPFRVRLFAAGLIMFSILVLSSLGVERLWVGETLDPPVLDPDYALSSRLLYASAGGLFILLAATSEELVFRGVFLQLTGGLTRKTAVLVVVNGIAFSAVHLDPAPDAFVARAVSGAVWAWTVLRLAGLELALGAHFANNLWLLLLAEPFSEGVQVGRELPLPYLVGDVVITLIMAVSVHFGLRSARVRGWIGEAPSLSLPGASRAVRTPSRRDEEP